MKAKSIALRDSILAALEETGAVPMSTDAIAAAIGKVEDRFPVHAPQWLADRPDWEIVAGPFDEYWTFTRPARGPDVYPHLLAMLRQGRVERIRIDGMQSVYWRRGSG